MSDDIQGAGGIELAPGQRVLSSGAIYDDNVKRIVANTGKTSWDHAQAREASLIRHERAQMAARAGMGLATVGNKPSALRAWAQINANMAGYASTERSIGAVKAAEFVGRAAGMLPDKAQQAQQPPETGAVIMLSNDAMATLAGILADMRAERADDD